MPSVSPRLLPALLVAFLAGSLQAQPREPIVRVLLWGRTAPESVTVRAVDGPLTLYADRGEAFATLAPGETATIARLSDRVRVRMPGEDRQASVIEAVPRGEAQIELRAGNRRKTYRGALSFEPNDGARTLRLVNYVPLETYVASVVASEYPFPEIEGVKAQAVLARTYALRAQGRFPAYDLTDDTGSQVYGGADAVTAVSREAAAATRGQVLVYNGTLAEAPYYSSSGGHTASNENVWNGAPVPYLRSRPDPYDAAAPDHRWTTRASASGLLAALGRRFGGSVTGIEVASRSPAGRVKTVRLLGARPRTISGSEFRATVNGTFGARTVRSTHFTLTRSGDQYVFNGRGFGHGVGMSQYGARGQALQGRTYRDILAFYFAGTTLDYHDALPGAAPVAVAPRRAHEGRASEASGAPVRRVAW